MELRAPPIPNVAKKPLWILAVCVLQAATLFAVIHFARRVPAHAQAAVLRDVASKLKAAGVLEQAAALYENYLAQADLSANERASVAFSLGELYLEIGAYEKALRWFYDVDTRGAPQELAPELGKRIVHTLERMGRSHAAQAVLTAQTALPEQQVKRPSDDNVVAKIGDKEIHKSDLTRAMDDLPPELAKRMNQDEFLRKYVADELIYRKAQKLEYDKDPTVRQRAEIMQQNLVVARFIEKEIVGKVQVSDADLQTYFNANKAHYDVPEAAHVRVLKRDHAETVKKIDTPPQWVNRGDNPLGEGDAKAVSDAIFALKKGSISAPINAGTHVYYVKLEELRAAKPSHFDEIKSAVEHDYRMMKTQAAYKELVEEELASSDVKLYSK